MTFFLVQRIIHGCKVSFPTPKKIYKNNNKKTKKQKKKH